MSDTVTEESTGPDINEAGQDELDRRALQEETGVPQPPPAGYGDPAITSLAPNSGAVSAVVTVTVTGTGFEAGSTVEVNGAAQSTSFVSSTELTASYTPDAEGTVQFTVRNPSNAESNDSPFTVTAATQQSEVQPAAKATKRA